MEKSYEGICFSIKNVPDLDPDYVPFGLWAEAFLSEAHHPVGIAVEREQGNVFVFNSKIRGESYAEANFCYMERMVKLLLWSVGGFRVYVRGCDEIAIILKEIYSSIGERRFDAGFMKTVYERDLEIIPCGEDEFPTATEKPVGIGGYLDGCRIGFDAGGSDRKVSAVIDGKTVYSEETIWFPKLSEDSDYQYGEIVKAFKTAASNMPRVDAIGVSSAGVFVNNKTMVSSLFIKIPDSRREEIKDIYERAAKEIGNAPISVCNDGDVTALAGAMSLNRGEVMGIAMGTSEAAGYVNKDKKITGRLNELAFAPLDLQKKAPQDEWSGDFGVGCKYLSQDAVIRLAPRAGITLCKDLSPAEKLKEVQRLAEDGHDGAKKIFETIGSYLAHAIKLYSMIYSIHTVLILGRVSAGIGGEILISACRQTIKDEYPEIVESISVMLPDEKIRRVGQSIAAASLPEI